MKNIEKNYRNIGFILLLFIPLVIIGFLKSYIGQLFDPKQSLHILIHLHFIVSALWVLLMIAQPLLIRFKRQALHRKAGKLSYLLFGLFNLTLVPFIMGTFSYTFQKGSPTVLIATLFNLVLVNLFFILAIKHRKNIALHMRYMIALALVFVSPPLGRIIMLWFQGSFAHFVHINFTLVNLLLLFLIFWDKTKQRNYQPYLLAITAFILNQASLHLSFVRFGL